MSSVGRSDRSIGKHDLFRRLSGRDVAMASMSALFYEWRGIDMTAGDAAGEHDSPRIFAKHVDYALQHRLEARADLFERDPARVELLDQRVGAPRVLIACGDSREDVFQLEPPGRRCSCVVLDDPNTGGGSTITPDVLEHLSSRGCWALTIFCVIGANAGGRQRLASVRETEPRHYAELIDHACRLRRQPIGCRIKGDPARFAYLVISARNDKMRQRLINDMRASVVSAEVSSGPAATLAMIEALYRPAGMQPVGQEQLL